jgi:hypothetical protein
MTDRPPTRSWERRREWPRRGPLILVVLISCATLLAVTGAVPAPDQTAMAQGLSTTKIQIDIDVEARGFQRLGYRGRDSQVNTDYRQGALCSGVYPSNA